MYAMIVGTNYLIYTSQKRLTLEHEVPVSLYLSILQQKKNSG